MKKTLLITLLSILFNLPSAFAGQVQIQGADNLCPNCSGRYLQYKNRLRYNNNKIAGSVNSVIIKVNRDDSFLGKRGKVIKVIEELMTKVSENSNLSEVGKKLSSSAFSQLVKEESEYSFFYQVSDTPSERNLWDEIAHSPYQVFATSGVGYDKFIMSFNVMSNYINALLSWVHEIYHLLDPLVIDFYEDESYSPLEIFILEYRASLIERDLYSPVKTAHSDHFGFANIDTPAYERLAKNDPLDLDTIKFILNRIYPTQEDKLPRYIPVQQNPKSKNDIILDEHQSNQQIFRAIESQSLVEFSIYYGFAKNDSAWKVLKEDDFFKPTYDIITQLLKDNNVEPNDQHLAQQLNETTLNLSSQIYFPIRNSSQTLAYSSNSANENLKTYLTKLGFNNEDGDLQKSYSQFLSHIKESYVSTNAQKRKEILKNLIEMDQKLFSSISNKYLKKNRLSTLDPLQYTHDNYLASILKGFIEKYKYHLLDYLDQLNKDSKYTGPKGANGGD